MSRIREPLPAGDYTIEATTYGTGETGTFTLTVSGISKDRDLTYLISGPIQGHFHHDPNRPGLSARSMNVSDYDVVPSARFENPYDASQHHFSHGFELRSNESTPSIYFYIHSGGWWRLVAGDTVHQGLTPGLRTLQYEMNWLGASVVGKSAVLTLNGELLTDLRGDSVFGIGPETDWGDVYIISGVVGGTEEDGAITHYDSARVYGVIQDVLIDDAFEADMAAEEVLQQSSPLDVSSGRQFTLHQP